MKKSYTALLLAILLTGIAIAQETQKNFINYQGVARNADNVLMSSEEMTINIALKFGNASATSVYEESHAISTDANGVFSLLIGNGSSTSGNYNTLPWGSAATFVTVSMNGKVIGTTEMMAVPYALSAGNIEDPLADEVLYDNSVSGLTATTTQDAIDELVTGGTVDADSDPSNEFQTLNFDAATNELSLSDGNSVTIPSGGTDADADPENELQTLAFDAGTNELSLSDGNSIVIPTGGVDGDGDSTNEIQTISFDAASNKISLTDGGEITIPSGGTDADADPENELQTLAFDAATNELSLSDGGTVTIPSGGTDADADPENEIDVTRRRGLLVGDDGIVDGLIGTADGQVAKWDAALGNWVAGTDETGAGGGSSLWNEEATHIHANYRVGINTGGEIPKTLFEIAGVPGVSEDVGFTNALFTITDKEITGGPFQMVMGGKAIQTLTEGVPSDMTLNLEGGDLGIGTFPTTKLDVNGDARIRNLSGSGQRNVMADADGNLTIGAGGAGSSPWTENGDDLYYTSGKVGIGLTNPASVHHVHSSSSITNSQYTTDLSGDGPNDGLSIGLVNTLDGVNGVINNKEAGALQIRTNNVMRMNITKDGDVGIGIFGPSAKLDVDGNIRSADLVGSGQRNVMADADGNLVIGSSSGGSSLWGEDSQGITYSSGNVGIGTASSSNYPLSIASDADRSLNLISSNANNYMAFNNSTGYVGYSGVFTGNSDMDFGTGVNNFTGKVHLTTFAIPKLTVVASGDVGIGTTDPTAKLDVRGDIKTSGEVHGPSTGDANMVPIAYGRVAENGTIEEGSGNFTINKLGSNYFVRVGGTTLDDATQFTSVATRLGSLSPGFISTGYGTSGGVGALIVHTFDVNGDDADAPFSFVIYQD